jgi:putative OPT family oligopeptide transporter
MLGMSFFFSAVASYIVGLVGNSNSPVSGMTITAVLGTGGLILLFGFGGTAGIVATLGVAGVVCCVACTSGDVCNDLKTGYLVGASPKNQQIMQILGVLAAALVMAPVMAVLHEGSLRAGTGGIGGSELPAPQAGLFAALAKGFFTEGGSLPKEMVLAGLFVGFVLLAADAMLSGTNARVRLHVMPVAVGIYLPFGLSVPILVGGLVRSWVDRKERPGAADDAQRGILLASGIIAGESLVGVLLGLSAYLGIKPWSGAHWLAARSGLSEPQQEIAIQASSLAALVAVALWLYMCATRPRHGRQRQ